MKDKFLPLFQPIKIGNTQIKNRLVMAPMAMAQIDENFVYKQESIDYFAERARGGVGLIITGANFVDNNIEKHIQSSFPCPTVKPSSYMKSMKKMTDTVHAYGAKLFVQLTAGLGRSAIPQMIAENTFIAPSETTNRWDPSLKHRAMTTEEIYAIISQFAASAKIAQMAGADGIEVHAVHEGYLLDCFTMEYFNKRTDEFGGSIEGRLRFPIAILKAVKQACDEDFPVMLRFSVKSFIKAERKGILPGEEDDYRDLGRGYEEGLMFAKLLTESGFDALNVDAGSYDSWYWAHPPFFFEPGVYRRFARMVKETVSVPVLCAGKLGAPDNVADVITSGDADMVALGRPLLADPQFVSKLFQNEEEYIRPCLYCHEGCFGRPHHMQLQSCAVNPQCNREREASIEKAETFKKCLVIGGGPTGMEAARVLALRGHEVKLIEKQKHLGGLYYYAVIPGFKNDGKKLIAWYERTLAKLNVEITLGYELKEHDNIIGEADVIINATGSIPFKPGLPGIQLALTAVDALCGAALPDEVVIIGAGLVGCELSIWLGERGIKSTIIDMADKIMATGTPPDMNKQMITELMEKHEVNVLLSRKLHEIKPNKVIVSHNMEEEIIMSEKTILAMGYRPNALLYVELAAKGLNIYNIGDSNKPRDIMSGIWDAYELCSHI